MNRCVLKNNFLKVYIYHFLINIFIKNKKSKLDFGDCGVVLNDFFYKYEGSIILFARCFVLLFVIL